LITLVSSSMSSLTLMTSPLTGEISSATDLADSIEPKASSCSTSLSGSGSSTE